LENEELHNLYSLPNITGMIRLRRMSLDEHAECMEGTRNAYKVLSKRLLGRPTHR
jgi:hypothetical protein